MKVTKKSLVQLVKKAGIDLNQNNDDYKKIMLSVQAVTRQNEKVIEALSNAVKGGDKEVLNAVLAVIQQNNKMINMLTSAMKPEDAMKSVAKVIQGMRKTNSKSITGKVTARDENGFMTDFKLNVE